MVIFLDDACARRQRDNRLQSPRSSRSDHRGCGLTDPPKNHDGLRHHLGIAAHHVVARTGANVMKRIAAPMVGGRVTATQLTLLVIPCLYCI